jgi:hypothetical protein
MNVLQSVFFAFFFIFPQDDYGYFNQEKSPTRNIYKLPKFLSLKIIKDNSSFLYKYLQN